MRTPRLAISPRLSRRLVVSALFISSSGAFGLVSARPQPVAASGLGFTEFAGQSNAALTCVMDGLHNPRGISFGLRLPTRVVTAHVCPEFL